MTTLLAITSVQASPFVSSLNTRDLFVPSDTCNDIVLGAKATVIGRVCVSILDGTMVVNYGPISPYTYSDVHVYVGTTAPTNRAPGSFPYSSNPGGACILGAGNLTSTCTIPVQSAWRSCGQKIYIATHASIAGGGTAWGAGPCFEGSTGNCAKYWNFFTQCFCRSTSIVPPVTYTVRPFSRSRSRISLEIGIPINKINSQPLLQQLLLRPAQSISLLPQ